MASIIKLKRSSTPSAVPGSLAAGELAINTADKKLYSSNGSAVFQIGESALANTNAYIATRASWAALTSTNTALRTLISDRLQVANAAATYQTISIERAALANTNVFIATKVSTSTFNSALANTNVYIATKVDTSTFNSALANTNSYIATKANATNPTTSGLLAHTGRLTVSTNLTVSGNTHIDGNLTVEGGVTYISSSTLNVDDSMIKLAANNSADTIDTGAYGKYVESGTTKYAGYFRDATDGVFKFYTALETEPTTTVDTGGTGYALATVDAVIDGGSY